MADGDAVLRFWSQVNRARRKNVWIVPDMPKTPSAKIMRRVSAAVSNFADVGGYDHARDPPIVEDNRHYVQSEKVVRGEVPREPSPPELEEIKAPRAPSGGLGAQTHVLLRVLMPGGSTAPEAARGTSEAVVKMTQQYVAGEVSVRLGQLQAVATDRERAGEVARLRYEAETVPLAALGSVVVRALGLADRLCWHSLGCGDALAFSRQAAICAELWEFGVCARLFEEDLEFD